ncbi:ATP-binding protein, partial [Campylobacter vicugnae]|uniref:ATP-binding protein n=1 Tax=Campylobacter vicugnae TaxID=1660076 RepID=UPI00254B2D2B
MINKNTRGSEWHKWDLHIHTPFTGKNDQFEGANKKEKWEKYLNKIEKNTDTVVLGITDYFSIENYLYMVEQQKNGRIPNVYLIPNVELRILPVTRTETPINIHVLFDPNLSTDIIRRDFFNQLEFEFLGSKYQCNKDALIQLGRAVKTDVVSDEEAYKNGLNQFNITFPDLRNVLKAKSLEGHYIVGVANSNNDGNSGIQDSALSATRKEIYRLSDFIFSANPNDIKFFLGNGRSTKEQLIKEYGSLKPCVRGCDAHELNKMFCFEDKRYTWIKALPTFNGLKQILYEPEDRVCISEEKPEDKSDYQIIDSIIFNNSEMNHQEIMFNQNLNTIIGGRSSGKSILLGCLASTIDPKIEPKDNEEFKKYNKHIKELNEGVSIKWRDNTDEYRKIIYYSQSAISEKVREDEYGISGISELVEEIVKKEPDKFELLKNYDNFVTVNKSEINTKINEFCQYKN